MKRAQKAQPEILALQDLLVQQVTSAQLVLMEILGLKERRERQASFVSERCLLSVVYTVYIALQ